jgi:hypothetical protein
VCAVCVCAAAGCDVMDMVSRQPRLLLQEPSGLPGRLLAILAKLQALHPSHMQAVVAGRAGGGGVCGGGGEAGEMGVGVAGELGGGWGHVGRIAACVQALHPSEAGRAGAGYIG